VIVQVLFGTVAQVVSLSLEPCRMSVAPAIATGVAVWLPVPVSVYATTVPANAFASDVATL